MAMAALRVEEDTHWEFDDNVSTITESANSRTRVDDQGKAVILQSLDAICEIISTPKSLPAHNRRPGRAQGKDSISKTDLRTRTSAAAPRKGHRIEDVMKLCCEFPFTEEFKTTWKGSKRGAVAAGSLALIGGLCAGPVGIAVGGTVGSLLGWWITRGQFRPVPQIIMEFTPQQQQKLYDHVMAILKDIQWEDMVELKNLLLRNDTLRQKFKEYVLKFIEQQVMEK